MVIIRKGRREGEMVAGGVVGLEGLEGVGRAEVDMFGGGEGGQKIERAERKGHGLKNLFPTRARGVMYAFLNIRCYKNGLVADQWRWRLVGGEIDRFEA